MRFPGFIGPSYTLESVNVDCQRCINLYPKINELGKGKEGEVACLVGTPGLSTLATLATSPTRGGYTATNGRCFVVGGNKLYELSSAWVATERGTLNSSEGMCSFADNGTDLVLIDGDDGYYLTFSSNSFAVITDPDWLGASSLTYQDGYFIFTKPDSGQFFYSDLNSTGIQEDAQTSEGSSDNLVACISDHRDLWMFNEKTAEVYFNSGGDLLFERVQGAFIEHGCAAKGSVAKANNTVFWLGRDKDGSGVVYMAKGYQPQKISTHAVDLAIQGYGDVSDATAYTYQENGHYFYCLNFTEANTTWVFDSTTNLWHERVYSNEGRFERHRANWHTFAFSTHIVGDYENGKIYKLSSAVYTDAGDEIVRRRVAPHISNGMKYVFYNAFQLDMEPGVGLDGTTQGTDPQVMLQFSDDGGHQWSNEKWVGFGKIGQRKARALWRRLGRSRDRVFRITISDPVKVVLIGAEITIEAEA